MIILILLLSLTLRLINLNQSFWLDESAQAVLSSKPIFSVDYGVDFSPPLLYVLSHFWMKFGITSEWFLRLPSVFFGVATVYLTYYFFTKLFDRRVGIVSSLLLATAPYHIYYSQEFRMYSLLTLLVLLSWIFLWEKRWKLSAVTVLAGVFTHYFAFLAILSQALFVFVTRRDEIRHYMTTTLAGLLPFLLWLPTLSRQIETARHLISVWPRWREVSSIAFLKFPGLVLAKFTVGMISPEDRIVYASVVAAVASIFLISLLGLFPRIRKLLDTKDKILNAKYALVLFYFFVPLVAAWISGLWIAANTPWRLLFVLPAFYGIIAIGLSRQKESKYPRATRLAVIIILVNNVYFSSQYLLNARWHREDWRGAVAWTDDRVGLPSSAYGDSQWRAGENTLVLTESAAPWVPIDWYSTKSDRYLGASTTMDITDESIEKRLVPFIPNTNSFILYTYLFELSDPKRRAEKYLRSNNFELTEEKDFRGVGIVKIFKKM